MDPNFQPLPPKDAPDEDISATEVPQPRVQDQGTEQPYFNEETFVAAEEPSAQPVTFPDYTAAPTVPDAFAPAPRETLVPDTAPIFPVSPVQPVVDSSVPTDAYIATPVVLPPKKKSRLLLWVSLGAVFLILVGLVAGYFIIKGAADTSAKSFTVSEKSYIDDVYDAATSPAATPSDILKDIKDIKSPVLESAILSNVSGEYQTAEKLQSEAKAKVDTLRAKITDYSRVDEFYTDYLGLYASLQVLDSKGTAAVATKSKTVVSAYLEEFLVKLKDVDMLIKDTTVPSDLQSDLDELGRVHGSMSTNWEAMVTAFNRSNSAAYDAAFSKYVTAAQELARSKVPIADYFKDLSSKSHDAAQVLKDYRSSLN